MGLLPNPNELFKQVDRTVDNVEGVLARVDGTLADVSVTLADATSVLGDVRILLMELKEQMGLLEQVPAMAAKLDEVHAIVSRQADRPG